jgi:DNA helicase-2/ATP-dependent DNA helicase PcrA
MLRLVIDAGYEDYLEETYANYRTRLEDLQQLGVFAQQFPNVEDFLTQLALLSNVEAEDDSPTSKDDEQLRLSTLRKPRPRVDVVFVIMLCDGLFPSGVRWISDVLEERRLFHGFFSKQRLARLPAYSYRFRRHGRFNAEAVRFYRNSGIRLTEWNLKPFSPLR